MEEKEGAMWRNIGCSKSSRAKHDSQKSQNHLRTSSSHSDAGTNWSQQRRRQAYTKERVSEGFGNTENCTKGWLI